MGFVQKQKGEAMADLIRLEDVLAIIDKRTVKGKLQVAREVLGLQTVKPEPHWIPCSERLPEDGERVLATHLGGLNPDRQVIEHIYKNGEFTLGWDMDINMDSPTFGQRYMGKVVAWMPLPECYREGEG